MWRGIQSTDLQWISGAPYQSPVENISHHDLEPFETQRYLADSSDDALRYSKFVAVYLVEYEKALHFLKL